MPAHHELLDRLRFAVFTGAGGARYKVLELLGEGGQGWVFKASQDDAPPSPHDGAPGESASRGADRAPFVVVKILRPDVATTDVLARFEREATVLRAISSGPSPHPHIVRFHEHGRATVRGATGPFEVPYLILEYVDGPTLARVLAAHGGFGLPVARVRRILRQVARALEDLHAQGVVHRDLKPSNILLSQPGSGAEIAKVTDFGIVKVADATHQTITIAGASAGYAPPEQYEVGNRRVTPRTDVFSFGAILFEALSGCEAFPVSPGDTALRTVARMLGGDRPSLAKVSATIPRELRDKTDLTLALDREIARATDGDPDRRHTSIDELWNAIEPLLRAAATSATASRPPDAPPSVPASAPTSGPSTPRPASSPTHRIVGRPMTGERLRGAAFANDTQSLVAVGAYGLYRFASGVWSAVRTPRGLEARSLRGVARAPSGDLLLFGEGCAALLSPAGSTSLLDTGDTDSVWLGALADDRGILLVGERRSRPVGVVALVAPNGTATVRDLPGTTRMLAAVRLDAGVVLACGTHGALVALDGDDIFDVPWGRTGHLHAATPAPDGGAFIVGSGGHALAIAAPSPSLRGVAPPATLESVQTTRDLASVIVDPSGTAWTVGAQGRLLVRHAGAWSRVAVELGSVNLIALAARARPHGSRAHEVVALADDGTVVEIASN